MSARNGNAGYGWVSKGLHWLTVLAVLAQFTVGLTMEADDSGRGRGRGRSGSSGRGRGRGGDESYLSDPDLLLQLHVGIGISILVLIGLRVIWRRVGGLPPWSEHLSESQRRVSHWTERSLLALLVLVPVPGLLLVAVGDDDLLPLHIAAQIAFLLALAVHLSSNLRPKILRRML